MFCTESVRKKSIEDHYHSRPFSLTAPFWRRGRFHCLNFGGSEREITLLHVFQSRKRRQQGKGIVRCRR